MRKTLTVLGAVGLVLGIAATATATGKLLVRNANLATGAVNSRAVADGSLWAGDLQAAVRTQLATAIAPITEARLDDALKAKVNREPAKPAIQGVLAARVNAATAAGESWVGVTFPAPLAAAFDKAKLQVKVSPDTSAQCRGSVASPQADPGYLCVYLDGGSTTNAGSFGAAPVANLGMRFEWKATVAGLSSVQGTYAYTPAS